MKINSWTRKLGTVLVAGGIWLGSAGESANAYDVHSVGDANFDDVDVNASTYTDYAYIASGHVTAWEQRSGLNSATFDSGWFYNSTYGQVVTGERPTPRSGSQAYHGSSQGEYIFQTLTDTYQANRTYTFSAWIMGDGDLAEADRQGGVQDFAELILYDGSVDVSASGVDVTDPANSLSQADFNWFFDGDYDLAPGDGSPPDPPGPPGGGTGTWTQLSVSHTVLAGAAEIGSTIGLAINHGNEVAFDDVTVTSVPEPTSLMFIGLGSIGALALRRRQVR